MIFKVLPNLGFNWPSKLPFENNTIWMVRDDWDDFGYKTVYHIAVCINDKNIPVGSTRIMKIGQQNEYTFEEGQLPTLNEDYISFGHQKYYEALMEVPENIRNEILLTLKDTVFDNRAQEFVEDVAFRTSLLRNNSIGDISFYKSILEDGLQQTPFESIMTLKVRDSEELVSFSFNTIPDQLPPSNIHALIGRNASGKTQFLNALSIFAKNLNEEEPLLALTINDSLYQSITVEQFPFKKNIHIQISQRKSTEEEILKEKDMPESNLPYIPINFNIEQKSSRLETYLQFCFMRPVIKRRWIKLFKELNTDPLFEELDLIPIDNFLDKDIANILEKYEISSSGHKYIIFILTVLVCYVDDRSLVTIDEPENHLHPPLLASFIRALSQLLISRNGIAILATHSPVVLQEIPSSCVSIINRAGKIIHVTRPEIETFAENIGTLTQEVFKLEVRRSGFYKLLQKEVEAGLSYEEILDKFNQKIGLEGKVQLSALINEKE